MGFHFLLHVNAHIILLHSNQEFSGGKVWMENVISEGDLTLGGWFTGERLFGTPMNINKNSRCPAD